MPPSVSAVEADAGGGRGIGPVRRMLRDRSPLSIALVIASLVWIAFTIGSPLTGRTTFQSDTILSTFAPWRAAAANDVTVTQYCNADTIDSVQPTRALVVSELRHGRLAGYDQYQVGGTYTALSQNAGVFDPVTLIPFTTLPVRVAPAYEKVLELAVVLLGMVLWVRRLGMSTTAGVVGGFVFGLSGFMVTWTNWPQTSVACWIPMLFWSAERLAQRRTLSSALLLTLPLASMILGGFPAVTGWSVYAVAAYLGMRLLSQRQRVRSLVQGGLLAGLGGALAGGLSAFSLLPFVRAYSGRDFGYRDKLGTAVLNKQALATTAFPNAFGGCGFTHGHSWVLQRGYVESDMFIGTAALVLCVVALTGRLRRGIPRGPRVFAVVLALFLANQMIERNALGRFVATLPVFVSSPPGRLRAVFSISFALLAAMGVDRLVARSWQPRWWRRWQTAPVVGVWVLVTAVAVYLARETHRIDVQNKISYLTGGVERALIVAAATALLVLAAATVRHVRVPVVLAVAALVAVQGAAYARGFWPRDPNDSYYPTTPAQSYLDTHLGTYRATGNGSAFRSGTATFYRSAAPVGHAFVAPDWNDLLTAADPRADITRTFTQLSFDDRTVRNPILDLLSLRYVMGAEENTIFGAAEPSPPGTGSVPLSASGSVSGPGGSKPLRAVAVTLTAPLSVVGAPHAALHADVLDGAGDVVGSGTRRIYAGLAAGAGYAIAVTDPGAAVGPYRVRVTLLDDPHPTGVAGTAGVAAFNLVTRTDDGLRLVSADGSVVYERLTALPHVRWVSRASLVPAARQTALLAAGIPSDEVLLAPGAPQVGSGAPASVSVRSDTGREIDADVTAQGSGYLVVSDADLPGWSVSVDGRSASLLVADHGLQAVAIPAGTHRVVLQFAQRGAGEGVAITIATLLVYASLWAVVGRRRRGGRDDRAAGTDHP